MVIFNIIQEERGVMQTLLSTSSFKKARLFFNLTKKEKVLCGNDVVGQQDFCEPRIKVGSRLYDGDISSFLYANDDVHGVVALKCDMA